MQAALGRSRQTIRPRRAREIGRTLLEERRERFLGLAELSRPANSWVSTLTAALTWLMTPA